MANITHLPEEILLYIVQVLKPEDENHLTGLDWTRVQPNWWNRQNLKELESEKEDMESYGCYSTLMALSYTNRCFYRLCNPIIYSKVDLVRTQDYCVAMNKKQYVQFLRVKMSSGYKFESTLDVDQILSVLGACSNVKSLVIIYHSIYYHISIYSSPPLTITSKVISLLESGQLKALSICAHGMDTNPEQDPIDPMSLFSEIRARVPRLHHDQHIHVAASGSGMPIYSQKHSTKVYFPPTNLVSLKFLDSWGVTAPQLPDLILHCPRLRYLFVSACGGTTELRQPLRPSGWNTHSDALYRQREPLEEFHIEHMLEWEILAMGTIPARRVIMTGLMQDDMHKSFMADPEIFPGLTFLRYEPRDDMPSGGEPIQQQFHAILKQRNVRWKADAAHIYATRR